MTQITEANILCGNDCIVRLLQCFHPSQNTTRISSLKRRARPVVKWKLSLLRAGMFIVLGLVMGLLGGLSFLYLSNIERANFHEVFDSSLEKMSYVVDNDLTMKLKASQVVSQMYSYGIDAGFAGVVPNITITSFSRIMGSIGEMSYSGAIFYLPILTNKTRRSWEAYASSEVDALEGPSNLKYSVNNSWVVSDGCYAINANGTKVYSPGYTEGAKFPFLVTPQWQISPMSYYKTFMFDAHSNKIRADAIDRAISENKSAFTDVVESALNNKYATNVYTPVIDSESGSAVGLVAASFTWDTMFENLLPSYIPGIHVVISTPSTTFTLLVEGNGVSILGKGDFHDTFFDVYKNVMSASVASFSNVTGPNYTITVYPTHELYNKYVTTKPGIACGLVVSIMVFTAMVIVFYDHCVVGRERSLQKDVEITTNLANLTLHELENKKNFVRYISHEIRTPLSTVKLGLELLEQNVNKKGLLAREMMETIMDIRASCNVALEVVNEFLLFDKIAGEKLSLDMAEFDLVRFVKQTVKPFRVQAGEKGVELILQNLLPEGYRAVVHADEHKLAQVVRNLVSNALKFTPRGGRVSVSLHTGQVADESASTCFFVDVTDSGAGISLENQEKLFKEVVQFHANRLQGGGGSGLGLYISHGIMKQHGGHLTVHSEGEGLGSTFTLAMVGAHVMRSQKSSVPSFPFSPKGSFSNLMMHSPSSKLTATHRVNAPERVKSTNSVASGQIDTFFRNRVDSFMFSRVSDEHGDREFVAPTGSTSHHLRIFDNVSSIMDVDLEDRSPRLLVVDDAAVSRKLLTRLLKQCPRHFDCVEACDGLEAVEYMRESLVGGGDGGFEAVLMDFNMPNMNGPDAASAMREMGFTGRIIGVTGHAGEDERDLFVSRGANFVLVKPVSIQAIISAVD